MANSTVPAILIGSSTTALGTLRSLAGRGVSSFVACTSDDHVTASRFFRPVRTPKGETWQGQLGDVGERFLSLVPQPAMLFPCSDESTMWVATLPHDLQRRFLTSVSSPTALRKLQDKRQFASLCSELQVPHPRSFMADAEDELEPIPFHELDRAFIKPWNSRQFIEVFEEKGLWVRSVAEAQHYWRQATAAEIPVFVQEYIPGGAERHCFIDGFRDRNGSVRACLARRRHRMHPPGFGNSSFCRHIPLADVAPAWASLQKILDDVNYRGIFSAEFKQDAHDGLFKIIEVNTRAWVYIEFATYCGVNVAEMAYRDALDLPVRDAHPRRLNAGCANLYFDARDWRESKHRWRFVPQRIGEWLWSHKPVFSWRDPGPSIKWLRRQISLRTASRRRHSPSAAAPETVGGETLESRTSRSPATSRTVAGYAAITSAMKEEKVQ